VTDIDKRLSAIESKFAAFSTTLDSVTATTAHANAKSLPARFLSWMGDEGPKLIGAAVLLIISYWIKDSVDLAIKRQQLQLDVTKEMKTYLEVMADSASNADQIERAAVLLAAYGQPAAVPLLNEVRHGGLRATAAESALSFVGLGDPEDVCQLLQRALSNRTQQFGWEAHLRVIRLLGGTGCRGARSACIFRSFVVTVSSAS
jgi:hypothetical protein